MGPHHQHQHQHGNCPHHSGASLKFRIVKALDIGYTGTIFIVAGLICGILINHIVPRFEPCKGAGKSSGRLLLEIAFHFWIINILTYASRNVCFPSPFHLWEGFDHWKLKEYLSAAMFGVILTTTQPNTLMNKVVFSVDRLSG